ncbi:MAG TPA: caspase family protein [Pyrinomonadaceae bacterium]
MKLKYSFIKCALIAVAAISLFIVRPVRPAIAQQGVERDLGIFVKAENGKPVKLYDKSYALLLGVSDYTSGWPKLPGVKQDMAAVRAALEQQGFQVIAVENPTAVQLDDAFRSFILQYGLGIENRLLFYFAGHGHTIRQSYGEDMGYIVPADAPNPNRDPVGFATKAMDMQQMELYARRIQSKHALFLFDSCFSGSFFALSRAVPANISYKTSRPVRQFITSGSAEETVPDLSIFRRQFILALEGEADNNKDGYVTGSELGDFLQDRVINYSRNAQHPQYGKIRNPNLDKGDFVFALPKTQSAPPPAGNAAKAEPARLDPATMELAFWNAIQNSVDAEDYKEYLEKYPNGQFAGVARRRSAAISAKVQPPTPGKKDANVAPPSSSPETEKPRLIPTERMRLTPLTMTDAPTGARVTITSNQDLKDYSAYRSGDRFIVIIPNAEIQRLQRVLEGHGFSGVQLNMRGNDVVISFRMQPGSTARVNQRFNRLDVQFSVPK